LLRAFVVRHAQSLANHDALLSSAYPGPTLTDLGHQQSRDLADQLAGQDVSRVYSSPLLRTQTTAGHIAQRIDLEVIVLTDLREFGLGDWEGRPGTDRDILDHPVFSNWLRQQSLEERFQGGESAAELQVRLTRALDAVLADDPTGTVVLVTHGGLMAVAVPLIVAATSTSRIPANAEAWELIHDGTSWRSAGGGDPEPWTPPETVLGG
jgi:probable phosphoglycerate mutase